jgi:EAL domain-containing protein (putative c-di-GMP-specific phosphodiesterase class I)/PAS domain-containing protein/GGDEF domain-containing protein
MQDGRQAGRDFSFSASSEPAWLHDVRTLAFLAVNDAAVRRYGYSRERFLSLALTDICPDGDAPEPAGRLDAARHRTAAGEHVFVRTATSDLLQFGDREARITVVFDVTEWRTAYRRLSASLAMLRHAETLTGLGSWVLEPDGGSLDVSDAMLEMFGTAPGTRSIPVAALLALVHPDDAGAAASMREAIATLRPFDTEYRIVFGETVRWCSSRAKIIEDDDGPRMIGTVLDVTDRIRSEERLHELARLDPIVGIPNRAALSAAFAGAEPALGTAVFAIRLDIVHQVATELSDAVAQAAAAVIRDTLAAGCSLFVHSTDVFVALCPSIGSTFMARTCAELLVAAFIPPLPINDGVVVNVTVGVDIAADAPRPLTEMLAHALTALHRTGRHGSRVCTFTPDMQQEALRADAIDRHLRAAPQAEFSLAYQPVVSLESHQVIGVEALLRWSSAELGAVSPAEFIPVAERSGFIADLGSRVLRMATDDYAGWQLAGARRPKLMINVSAHQLRSPVLLAELQGAVDRTGISMGDIDLELTETAMMEQLGAGVERLNELRDRGVRICLDDFGMGYSSLNYLAELPLDVVKIDRSFVSGMRQDPIKRAVVHSVIELAHEIGASVIGEGVEQRSEAERLRRLHCDAIQGYWVARPMSREAIPARLAAGF